MGMFDDLLPGAAPSETPKSGLFADLIPPPPRTAIGEIGTALKAGAKVGLPRLAAAALGAPSKLGLTEAGAPAALGGRIGQYADEQAAKPDLQLEPEKHGAVTNFLAGGAQMLAESAPAVGAGLAGGAIGALVGGPVGGVAGGIAGGIAGAVPYGLQAGEQTYEKARGAGLAKEAAQVKGRETAAAQTAIMAGAGALTAGVARVGGGLVNRALGTGAADAAQAGEQFLNPGFAKPALTGAAETIAAQTAMGTGGAAAQAAIEQGAGGTQTPLEAAKEALAPSAGAGVLFTPLALIGAGRTVMARNRMGRTLADGAADPQARGQVAETLAGQMNAVDPAGAETWFANAKQAIREGKPINVDAPWTESHYPPGLRAEPGTPLLAGPDAHRESQLDEIRKANAASAAEHQEPVVEPPAAAAPAGPLERATTGADVTKGTPAPPDAGPISRVAAAVEPAPDESHVPLNNVTQAPDLAMQNRDRSRPASIAQMQAIAAHPDYDRLGVGQSPNEAAPMVSVGANAPEAIPEGDFGRSSRVVMADGSKMAVRYAVVDADSVLASHNADGTVNGDYFAQIPSGTIRALNNGRIAALQDAYGRGSAEDYRQAMIDDAAAHGVSAQAIEAKKNPVLVRVYDDAENARPNIGALSNPQVGLKMSSPEQAHNDARLLDAENLKVGEDGNVLHRDNDGALRQFLQAIPPAEHNELVQKGGGYTKQFADRVTAALFARAYGNPDLVAMATEARDPDLKNVLTALTRAAPEFAKVEHGGPLDIRPALVEATQLVREGKARGLKPAEIASQDDLLQRDPMTGTLATFIAKNARSVNRLSDAFTEFARFMGSEKEAKSSGDMFGRPKAQMGDLLARANAYLEKEHGSEAQIGKPEKAAAEVTAERAPKAGGGGGAALPADRGESAKGQGAAAPKVEPYTPKLKATQGYIASHQEALAKRNKAEPLAEPVSDYETSEAFQELPAPVQGGLRKMVSAAARAKPKYDAAIEAIAAKIPGARAITAPIKGPKRAIEKVRADYAGDPTKLKDLVRGSIEIPHAGDAAKAVALIREHFDVLPTGQRDLYDPKLEVQDGYRDAKFNVRIAGHVAEIQVILPEMFKAKETGPVHVLYEERSSIERKAALDGNRDLSAKELAAIDELNAKMRAIYEPIFAAATSERKAAGVTGEPLRRADRGSKARSGQASQAEQAPAPGTPIDTGTPSTSSKVAPFGKEPSEASKSGREEGRIGTPIIDQKGAVRELGTHKDNLTGAFSDVRRVVQIERLVLSKSDERSSVQRAVGHMVAAIAGKRDKREPILVRENPDGITFTVIDGNSTVAAAKAAGWTALPIEVEKGGRARAQLAELAERQRAQYAGITKTLTEGYKRDGIVIGHTPEHTIALLENAHGTSKFRIQYFDPKTNEPTGHEEYDSIAEAARAFSRAKIDSERPEGILAEHAFELSGQTEAQTRLADARKAKETAAAKAKAAAPGPEGFKLAGSDRAADIGAAAGQTELFGPDLTKIKDLEISLPVQVEETGETYQVKQNAKEALVEARSRVRLLNQLLRCVGA